MNLETNFNPLPNTDKDIGSNPNSGFRKNTENYLFQPQSTFRINLKLND